MDGAITVVLRFSPDIEAAVVRAIDYWWAPVAALVLAVLLVIIVRRRKP